MLALVSRTLDLDPASALFQGEERTIIFTCEAADTGNRRRLSEVAEVLVAGDHNVDPALALDQLSARGLQRVLCEGGPTLLADVAAAQRLDELCLSVAPMLVGGDGQRILRGPEVGSVALRLAHLLEQDGVLFSRYVVG